MTPELHCPQHSIFSGDTFARLGELFDPIETCNTFGHPTNRVDIAPDLADAMACLCTG